MIKDIEKFADLIRNNNSIVFFGGAGVSTESGVKDYRSEDGLYNTVHQYGVSPETILSHHFFFDHTDVFYRFYYDYFLKTDVNPNKAHKALAELEKSGKLKAVITQNIDGLHQAAGSKNVIELHGTTKEHFCVNCHEFYDDKYVSSFNGEVPYCEKCRGIVKPNVVLYEEPLNQEVTNKALNVIMNADLLIIGGTSLAVYPAAGFLNYFRGDSIVLINRDSTPFDSKADLIFHDKIGEVLSQVIQSL